MLSSSSAPPPPPAAHQQLLQWTINWSEVIKFAVCTVLLWSAFDALVNAALENVSWSMRALIFVIAAVCIFLFFTSIKHIASRFVPDVVKEGVRAVAEAASDKSQQPIALASVLVKPSTSLELDQVVDRLKTTIDTAVAVEVKKIKSKSHSAGKASTKSIVHAPAPPPPPPHASRSLA